MRGHGQLLLGALFVMVGCADTTDRTGNTALGIATFDITETATKTIVVGLDATGGEVARLDLVHGRFALTGAFRDQYQTDEVDGRKMDVFIGGRHSFNWETRGYAPTLHMPAHPASEQTLAAFLADPHVSPVLERWQIGFDSVIDPSDEAAYTSLDERIGTWVAYCGGQTTCGTVRGYTVNNCGGGTMTNGFRIHDTENYGSQYGAMDEISQCCPSGSGGFSTNWWAKKYCPTTSNTDTPCGDADGGACAGCGGYDAANYCKTEYTSSGSPNLRSYYMPTCTSGGVARFLTYGSDYWAVCTAHGACAGTAGGTLGFADPFTSICFTGSDGDLASWCPTTEFHGGVTTRTGCN